MYILFVKSIQCLRSFKMYILFVKSIQCLRSFKMSWVFFLHTKNTVFFVLGLFYTKNTGFLVIHGVILKGEGTRWFYGELRWYGIVTIVPRQNLT